MARNVQVDRQWRIWLLLASSPSPLSAAEIVARLADLRDVTSRTVRRDLEVLLEVGVPLKRVGRGRDTRYTCAGDGPPVRLDAAALLALRLALGLLDPLADTPLGQRLEQIAVHFERALDPRVLSHFSALANRVHVRAPGAPRRMAAAGPTLDVIQQALAQGRTAAFAYEDSSGRTSLRVVHPQALVHGPRGLYLLAFDDARRGASRTFRLDRIASARVGAEPARAPTLDPDDLLGGSIGVYGPEHAPKEYRIRITSPLAARLLRENPWHRSQRLEKAGRGAWVLSLELRSSRELVGRVLSLGPDAEVLEPRALRNEVARLTREAAAGYRTTGSPTAPPSARP